MRGLRPERQQLLFRALGRLLAGDGVEGDLHLFERAKAGESSFQKLSPGRDDLFMQPLAVAADHHEPSMGHHGEVSQRRVGHHAGRHAMQPLLPFQGPDFRPQQSQAHLHESMVQVDEGDVFPSLRQRMIEDERPRLAGERVSQPFGAQFPASR